MSASPPLSSVVAHTAFKRDYFHILDVFPSVDSGRFAVKRVIGEAIDVWADIVTDGHAIIAAELLWRMSSERDWCRTTMRHDGNDRWTGTFQPAAIGKYVFAVEAWTDEFATWQHATRLKLDAGQDITLDALEGASMLTKARPQDRAEAAILVEACDDFIKAGEYEVLLSDAVLKAMASSQTRSGSTRSTIYPLYVDRIRAVTGAWYEMMPRSQGKAPGKHGTFKDCIARLPDVAAMGFDVLYFTPIHPIGLTHRKGRNNALTAEPGDPGSPYAIGASEGGHDAIHPELGTLKDFQKLVAAANSKGIEIALDFAIQCSPDHPWLNQRPNWFRRRPDGSIRYAENPPKKYQDIHNPDFASDEADELWTALRDVVLFWIGHGVKIFRVDNPHTKPLPFWEWLIADIQNSHPDAIFLAEAFTRPKVMKALAKLGFTQSYTYFTWRTEKSEIEEYLRELTSYPQREYYRPNFFVTTPDILPFHLQSGEPWMFKARLALAATLSGTYGIYNGYELLEHEAIPGKEEYLNSEKYEIKTRDWNKPGHIKPYITALNKARRDNPALQQTSRLQFFHIDNPNVIAFVKTSPDELNNVATVVALSHDQHDVWLPIGQFDVKTKDGLQKVRALENAITGERHAVEWGGIKLRIDPQREPALLFRCLA